MSHADGTRMERVNAESSIWTVEFWLSSKRVALVRALPRVGGIHSLKVFTS
jgi:hypothetical protein